MNIIKLIKTPRLAVQSMKLLYAKHKCKKARYYNDGALAFNFKIGWKIRLKGEIYIITRLDYELMIYEMKKDINNKYVYYMCPINQFDCELIGI